LSYYEWQHPTAGQPSQPSTTTKGGSKKQKSKKKKKLSDLDHTERAEKLGIQGGRVRGSVHFFHARAAGTVGSAGTGADGDASDSSGSQDF
jgi:hypothetical protein